MHLKRRRRGRSRQGRPGFTLIELLVVLAIIAILAALTTAAVMRFIGTGVGQATKTNLSKGNAKLNEQWKGVTEGALKDSLSAPGNLAYANAAGTNLADENTRKAYVALRQRQAFPTNFNEAFWPLAPNTPQANPNGAWPAYVTYLKDYGITPSATPTWGAISLDVQQAVLTLMILLLGPKNTGVTADDLGSAVGLVPLGNGNSPKGLVDGWRRPVAFSRSYQGKAANLALVSAGNDGKFGLDLTNNNLDVTTNTNDARDNIVVNNP